MRAVNYFLIILAVAALAVAAAVTPVVVQTTNGPVEGYYDAVNNVHTFKGIPYAAPPIGNLRFAPAAPLAETWTTPRPVQEFSAGCFANVCLGVTFNIPYICPAKTSEDCLYANVWVSQSNGGNVTGLPVLVYIHGGGYEFGSASAPQFDGADLAVNENIVVVTFNYRLGALGGLYVPGTNITGNFQTTDQIMLLQWVNANIASFGGDPTRVTISGESAGGASVSTLLMTEYPGLDALYQGAIIDSQAFASALLTPEQAGEVGLSLLAALNCSTGDALNCLRNNRTAAEITKPVIVNSHANFWHPGRLLNLLSPPFDAPFSLVWAPVANTPLVPGGFLPRYKIKFNHVPILMGTNANESALFVRNAPISFADALNSFRETFPGIANISRYFVELYGKPTNESDANMYLSRIITDYMFHCSNVKAAEIFAQHVPVYKYVFDYFVPLASKYCEAKHVCHGSDLGPLFGVVEPTAANRRASRALQSVWGSFVRHGRPVTNVTTAPGLGPQAWQPFDLVRRPQTNVSDVITPLADGFITEYCNFFDEIGYDF